jgi:amino acid adenylation domain-containing protein
MHTTASSTILLLPQRIMAQAAAWPESVAILHLGGGGGGHPDNDDNGRRGDSTAQPAAQPLRYGELHRAARAVAAALPHGAYVVALLLDEAPGSIVAELGVLYAGAAFVPLDPITPVARLQYQLADSGVSAVIHSRAQAAKVHALLDGDSGGGDAPQLRAVLPVQLEAATEAAARDAGAAAVKPAALQPFDASHIIYTSGSTGQPKGVVCEHGALAHYADAKLRLHGIDADSRVLLVSAATWDPSVGDAFSTLACGGVLVTAPRARLVQELHGVLNEGGVTHVCSTPALWGLLPAEAGWSSLPALRVVALGGERLPAVLLRQWLPAGEPQQERRLLNTYGVTEATVYQTVGECRAEQPCWVGRPLPGVDLAVAAAPGEVGEIWIGGPLVARGYLGTPRLTAGKFITIASKDEENEKDALRCLIPGRWFRTGDLGRWHRSSKCVLCVAVSETALDHAQQEASGPVLELMGRIDSQVKLRGFRIELGEVESVLTGHTLLGSAVVVLYSGKPRNDAEADAMNGGAETAPELEPEPEPEPRLVAYVTLSEGIRSSSWETGGAEVAVWVACRRQLPAHSVPTQFVRLE